VEEDAVGLAAEEHEVEDLDERWKPHGAGLVVFFKTVRSKWKMVAPREVGMSCYILSTHVKMVTSAECLRLVE
jgi:hypothetical protein